MLLQGRSSESGEEIYVMQNTQWAARVSSELLHPVLGMRPLEVTDVIGLLLKS